MERVTGGGTLPALLLASVGFLVLCRILGRLRAGAALQDAVVVITGATSGLGKECAHVFHSAGARLVLCGRDAGRLQQVVKELNASARGGKPQRYVPSTVTFDLADTHSIDRAAEDILKCYGRVDVLINNAGISYRGNILDTHISVQRDVMETNYFGPIALTQALLPSMVRQRSGHIVVISSVQGKIAIPYRSAFVDTTTATGRDPRDVAHAVLKAVRHKSKDVVLAGPMPMVAIYLRTLWPALFFKITSSRARKEHKQKNT
ncbi:dehydrogenase/reductase SDR family member 7B isoform X2 [Phyllopteryx taeniolatus]|uniref:dehydrogenase/reductase SDR family member 7B isoform X2 n=1 Tax=Phyllopteryx taeniolatus TaxID=161469 RepID=UPI002AD4EA2F|nr:dehydrogenase/reductase SDR family member 7B isoform X2 [Phyllopteryx taeniolatus]